MYVVVKRIENKLIFGKIKFILSLNNKIFFLLSIVESDFISKSNVYILIENQTEKLECTPYSNIIDFYPLQACKTMNGNLIVLKHGIVDNFD